MANYNLNDNVSENFEFELGGAKYTMRYPTLEEIEKLQKVVNDNPNDSQKMMEFLYTYISGEKDIKDVLPKQNIRVLGNFTKMIKSEFGMDA